MSIEGNDNLQILVPYSILSMVIGRNMREYDLFRLKLVGTTRFDVFSIHFTFM